VSEHYQYGQGQYMQGQGHWTGAVPEGAQHFDKGNLYSKLALFSPKKN
jgi:hypothetical protein